MVAETRSSRLVDDGLTSVLQSLDPSTPPRSVIESRLESRPAFP